MHIERRIPSLTVGDSPDPRSLVVRSVPPSPLITSGTDGYTDVVYGFEGGKVERVGDTWYLFVTEMVGRPAWVKTRLGLWKSPDGRQWTRVRTIKESTATADGKDPRAALWAPVPTFDRETDQWILTYVCYKADLVPGTSVCQDRNYAGEIAWAAAEMPGLHGIESAYEEKGVLMRKGPDSQPWEGRMDACSFYPYQVGGQWLAWYGASIECNGAACSQSNRLTSGWTRIPTDRPVLSNSENPIVFQLKDGLWIALFDGCEANQAIGYMFSTDGLAWSQPRFLSFEGFDGKWWELTRTPLGFSERTDGLYDLYFTAYNRNFYTIPGIWTTKYQEPDTTFDGFFASFGVVQVALVDGPA